MQLRLFIRKDEMEYELNINNYSSLFVNYTTDERSLIESVIDYFQPKSKKDSNVSLMDLNNDYEEIPSSRFTAITLSNDLLLNESKLGSKSFLKGKLKQDLLNNVEADGYINNINVLLEDLVEQSIPEIPVRPKLLTYDSIIKLLEVDLGTSMVNETNQIIHQNKLLLPILNRYLKENLKRPGIVFYFYPETYLSPREQKQMSKLLHMFSASMPVMVITKSKHFLADDVSGLNYFIRNKQVFNQDFIEELEWNCPLNFDYKELQESLMTILKKHIDVLEINPSLSNYTDADIILFRPIDLYVLTSIMYKMQYKFELNVNQDLILSPLYQYLVDFYEKI